MTPEQFGRAVFLVGREDLTDDERLVLTHIEAAGTIEIDPIEGMANFVPTLARVTAMMSGLLEAEDVSPADLLANAVPVEDDPDIEVEVVDLSHPDNAALAEAIAARDERTELRK